MAKLMELLKSRRLRRFVVAGGTSVLVDYGCYTLFLWLGLPVALAKGLSFACGCAVGFVINKYWSFQSGGAASAEVPKYVLLYACTALINAGVNWLVLAVWPVKMAGFLCATAVSTVLNFLGLNFVVFRRGGDENLPKPKEE